MVSIRSGMHIYCKMATDEVFRALTSSTPTLPVWTATLYMIGHNQNRLHCPLLVAMAAVSSKWCLEALNSNSLLCFKINTIKKCDEKAKVEVHCDDYKQIGRTHHRRAKMMKDGRPK